MFDKMLRRIKAWRHEQKSCWLDMGISLQAAYTLWKGVVVEASLRAWAMKVMFVIHFGGFLCEKTSGKHLVCCLCIFVVIKYKLGDFHIFDSLLYTAFGKKWDRKAG